MWWRKSARCSRKPKPPRRNSRSMFKALGSRQLPRASSLEPRACIKLMRVQGGSMAPTLTNGQLVVVSAHPYRVREPRRGEVVAARPTSLGGTALVKRLVALPHDHIDLDGQQRQLGEDEYFLLGEAASDSLDSRRFGPVSRHELIGPVCARVWPPKLFPA